MSVSAASVSPRPKHAPSIPSADTGRLRQQVCQRCGRNGMTPNPCPNRHKGAWLCFTSPSSAECLPCRNYFNGCCKGMAKSAFQTQIESSAEARAQYLTSLAEHEQLFDGSNGQVRNASSKICIPEWIQAVESNTTEGRMCVGVFWPKESCESTSKA
jgi:hypothetical protein